MSVVRRRSDCRLCHSTNLKSVLKLKPTPPANEFVSDRNEAQESFPLDVYFCDSCAHVQLLDCVDPAVLFRNYVYVSGTSPVFVKHFEDYCDFLLKEFPADSGTLVLDIGSNDGTFLNFFKNKGHQVLGIDPARSIAETATRKGIETLPEFFNSTLAERIREERGSASVIVANNVFAHIDDLDDIAKGVEKLLDEKGIFSFEVSYLKDVVEKSLFDTIYHEHLCYHSVKPLVPFFERNGLELIHVMSIPSHGGSLRAIVQRKGGPHAVRSSVAEFIRREEELGLDGSERMVKFAQQIEGLKVKLSSTLRQLRSEGKKIAGFGAPAKATTLMHHFEIGQDVVDFIVDDSPLKQNLYTPGLHVPVLPSSAIYEKNPDYLVILAWNFADPIIQKHQKFSAAGGKFIVPLPEVSIQ